MKKEFKTQSLSGLDKITDKQVHFVLQLCRSKKITSSDLGFSNSGLHNLSKVEASYLIRGLLGKIELKKQPSEYENVMEQFDMTDVVQEMIK